MDEGVAAASASKLAEATDAFDKVLARAPLFERRKEMVDVVRGAGETLARRQARGRAGDAAQGAAPRSARRARARR